MRTDNKCLRACACSEGEGADAMAKEVAATGAKMSMRKKVVVCGIYRRIIIFVFEILRK